MYDRTSRRAAGMSRKCQRTSKFRQSHPPSRVRLSKSPTNGAICDELPQSLAVKTAGVLRILASTLSLGLDIGQGINVQLAYRRILLKIEVSLPF